MLLSKARRGRKEKKKGLVDNNTSPSSQMAHTETRIHWWGLQA